MKFKTISKQLTVGAGSDIMQNDTIKLAIQSLLGYDEEQYQNVVSLTPTSLSGLTMKFTVILSNTNSMLVNGSAVTTNAFEGVVDSGGYVEVRSLEVVSADTISVLLQIK